MLTVRISTRNFIQRTYTKAMKKYQVIYADPPWVYQDKSKSHGGGGGESLRMYADRGIGQATNSGGR